MHGTLLELIKGWKEVLDSNFGDENSEFLRQDSSTEDGTKTVLWYVSKLKLTNVRSARALTAVLASASTDGYSVWNMPPTWLCMENLPYATKVVRGRENPKVLANLF